MMMRIVTSLGLLSAIAMPGCNGASISMPTFDLNFKCAGDKADADYKLGESASTLTVTMNLPVTDEWAYASKVTIAGEELNNSTCEFIVKDPTESDEKIELNPGHVVTSAGEYTYEYSIKVYNATADFLCEGSAISEVNGSGTFKVEDGKCDSDTNKKTQAGRSDASDGFQPLISWIPLVAGMFLMTIF